ncbi:uncharacterized protein GLRG_11932, partial [Colletotrichum graminicola M1.001]
MTFCITQRCGLCRFRLHDGERIVAGESSHPLVIAPLIPTKVEDAGQISDDMVYEDNAVDQRGSSYMKCLGDCSHWEGRTTGCHVECANQVSPWPVSEAVKVLAFNYTPTPSECDIREAWLRQTFVAFLNGTFRRLPPELCSKIAANLCIRTYAVACAKALRAVRGGEFSLCLSSKIWGRFTEFEGSSYLSSLSNNGDDYHNHLIFEPDPTSALGRFVYLAEDYFGVRKMFFSYPTPDVEELRGLWWRVVDLERSPTLAARSRCLKLRWFVSKGPNSNQHRWANVLWAVPPSTAPRLIKLEVSPEVERMSVVSCNDPSVVAYSVHWNTRIMSIHTHTREKELSMYHNRANGIWLFFPLYDHENIAEIWIRGTTKQEIALILTTTRGRSLVFGPHLDILPTTRLALIDLPSQDSSSRIFVEESSVGIRNVAFESSNPEPALSPSVSLPQPTYRAPVSNPQTPWFYSTASLDDVEDVRPCQRSIGGRNIIIGLLLRYVDGHEACLGQ